jgi:hypothetical protein
MPAATSSLMTVTLDVPTRTQKATMGFLAGAGGARAFHARSRDGRRAVSWPYGRGGSRLRSRPAPPCGITTWAALSSCGERSVDEIAPHLPATELEQTIVLVGRSPRLYARGTLSKTRGPRPSRRRPRLRQLTTPVCKAERRSPTPAPANHGDTMRSPLSEQAQAPNRGRQSR